MLAYIAIPLVFWLCALIAIPRRPRPGNEVEEIVYARLLGQHQNLTLLAFLVTAALFFALVCAALGAISRLSTREPGPASINAPGYHFSEPATSPYRDPRLVIDPRIGNG